MFSVHSEPLPGLKVLQPRIFKDNRGEFIKTYHADLWHGLGIDFNLREEFFSVSGERVLRGMHFQTPPHAHNKLVYCINGSVLDVVVDLRTNSPTFGQSASIMLSAENRLLFFIPVGFAHGFLSLTENSCMVYKTDAVYAPDCDTGIRWDSFGFDWPRSDLIVSDRDKGFPGLHSFNSCF